MPYMTFSQLRDSAMARIKPVMGTMIGTAAVYYGFTLIAGQVSSVSGLLIDSFALRIILLFVFTFLGNIFSRMLDIGFRCQMLKLYCGRRIAVGDIFHAFTNRTGTALSLSCVMAFLYVIPRMPFYIFFERYRATMDNMDFAIALFCFTPALVLTTMFDLIYSQACYLMLDFPACDVRQLFKNSRLLMHGHKGRLFYTQVCFIPFILIGGVCTCGVGMLWVAPFMYAVETEFYLDLVTKRRMSAGHQNLPVS